MPGKGFSQYSEKLSYLENLINELYENEKYLILVFILRCQLVEFSLKYLLERHPAENKPAKGKIDDLTMGQTISEIRKLKDSYMEDIIDNAGKLVDLRNEVTHRLINSEDSLNEIKEDIKRKMKIADEIEQNIFYYLEGGWQY